MKLFPLYLIGLLKFILSTNVKGKEILETLLSSLPTTTKDYFELNYPYYNINVTNIRFFRSIKWNNKINVFDDTIEAGEIMITVACDLKINMERNYSYNDFLIEFKISKLVLTKDKTRHKYNLSELSLNDLFMASLHDVVSSNTYKKFVEDKTGLPNNLKIILSSIFKDNLAHQNLYYYDLIDILNKLNITLTQYDVSFPHEGMAIKKVSAKNYVIEKIPSLDETNPDVLISRYAKFQLNYTVVDVNTGQINYLTEYGSFKCTKKENGQFFASEFKWNVLSIDAGNIFYNDIVNSLFTEIAKENEKKNQLINDDNISTLFNEL